MVVHKGEQTTRLVPLQPQGETRQLHGKGIEVYPIDAVRHDVPEHPAVGLRPHRAVGRAQGRDALRNTPRGGEQKMPAAAGGVDDGHLHQGLRGTRWILPDDALHHRLERAFDQGADQAVRSVVASRGLARIPRGGLLHPQAGELKFPPVRRVELHPRLILQQAFVDRPQLLGPHVAVVDRRQAASGLRPAQAAYGEEQVPVGEGGRVQPRTLLPRKQPPQLRKGKPRLTGRKPPEDHAHGVPQIRGPV